MTSSLKYQFLNAALQPLTLLRCSTVGMKRSNAVSCCFSTVSLDATKKRDSRTLDCLDHFILLHFASQTKIAGTMWNPHQQRDFNGLIAIPIVPNTKARSSSVLRKPSIRISLHCFTPNPWETRGLMQQVSSGWFQQSIRAVQQ